MKKVWIYVLCICCMWIPNTVSAADLQFTDEEKVINQIETSEYLLSPHMDMFIDWEKLSSLVETISTLVTEKPLNASLDKQGNVISGKSGVTLDKALFRDLIGDYVINEKDGTMEIPKKTLYPQVDSELISQLKTNKLGTYTTNFKKTNKERTVNITLATKAINNHVVFPGETFLFNEAVGERTKKRGYMQAPVIVKGEFSEDIGGGICQVSSTLYNAVDLVGLKIVKRHSHSRSVPYVPPGRDATVSWFGPDFVFENAYNQPILIRAFSENGNMIVTLYSSDAIQYKRKEIPELHSS